jgi:mevalonate kinase
MNDTERTNQFQSAYIALDEMYKKAIIELHSANTNIHMQSARIRDLVEQNSKILEEKQILQKEIDRLNSPDTIIEK